MLGALLSGLVSSRILAAQSGANRQAAQSQPAPVLAKENDVQWEYRVISYNPSLNSINGVTQPPNSPTLEKAINRLAEQGFEVDSLIPLAYTGGGGSENNFSITSEVVVDVLLKRKKK